MWSLAIRQCLTERGKKTTVLFKPFWTKIREICSRFAVPRLSVSCLASRVLAFKFAIKWRSRKIDRLVLGLVLGPPIFREEDTHILDVHFQIALTSVNFYKKITCLHLSFQVASLWQMLHDESANWDAKVNKKLSLVTNVLATQLLIKDINCRSLVGYKIETTRLEDSSLRDRREETVCEVGTEVESISVPYWLVLSFCSTANCKL